MPGLHLLGFNAVNIATAQNQEQYGILQVIVNQPGYANSTYLPNFVVKDNLLGKLNPYTDNHWTKSKSYIFNLPTVEINGIKYTKYKKFYYKYELSDNSTRRVDRYFSHIARPDEGFICHPAFIRNNEEVDYCYIQQDFYKYGTLIYDEVKEEVAALGSHYEMFNSYALSLLQYSRYLNRFANTREVLTSMANTGSSFHIEGVKLSNTVDFTYPIFVDGIRISSDGYNEFYDMNSPYMYVKTNMQWVSAGNLTITPRVNNHDNYIMFVPGAVGSSNTNYFINSRNTAKVNNGICRVDGFNQFYVNKKPTESCTASVKLVYYD